MFSYKLNEETPTMAENFSAAGYETGAFIGAHALSSEYGLHRGFDTYDEEFEEQSTNWVVGNRRPGSEVTSRALDWLDELENEYLLFLHYFDAHDGGDVPAAGGDQPSDPDERGGIRSLYDGWVRPFDEAVGSPLKRIYRATLKFDPNKQYGRRYHLRQVQQIDEQIGRLITALRNRGEYEDSTIVVLADHGDAFGEHGEYGHRKYIYDTTIRVPLILKPGSGTDIAPTSCEHPVRSIDVFPTLLEDIDVTTGPSEGVSLYKAITADSVARKAYAETRMEETPDNLDELVTDLVGLRDGNWKLIHDQINDSYELYDLETDPREQHNVAEEHESVRDDLASELEETLSDAPSKDENLLSDTERAAVEDRLQGLGYL